nr:MAG TPA: hypothetical protein [Caudoviricetes sp.]
MRGCFLLSDPQLWLVDAPLPPGSFLIFCQVGEGLSCIMAGSTCV